MIYYLFFTTLILTAVAYFANHKDWISPSFLFSLSFLFASFFLMLNINNWGNSFDLKTYLVICLGILEFIIVCYLIDFLSKKTTQKNLNKFGKIFLLDKGYLKLLGIEILQLFFILIIVLEIKRVTGQSNISNAINLINKSANGYVIVNYSLPTYIGLMETFNQNVGILGEYLFIRELTLKKHFSWILFLEALIGIFSPMLSGSRGGTIYGLISLAVFTLMIQQRKSNWNSKKNRKYISIIILSVIAVLLLLQWSATLVGRNVASSRMFDYISIYVGAELKNLNGFITTANFPIVGDIFGQQTFYKIILFLIKHVGLRIPIYNLDLPFQFINGYNLGNVYTTFYPWLYDFGYKGVAILIFVMAAVSQWIYKAAKRNSNNFAPFYKLFYGGTIAPCIAFSFFSNKFYEAFDIISIILSIIIWKFLSLLFAKDMK
ncbi:O-antigen polymerase [Lactobacillus agrestimuris]|uniref:O-antigen polymerase n=1 Tax=Lactobacillus agrestimuris TaxID=2941328 RepID=UPI002042C8A9|nr:O-antigen polymerase [Lactobacillus agrestimuris]